MDTIEASPGQGPGSAWAAEEARPAQRDQRRVYAVHFPSLGHVAGFRDLELAHATAEPWHLDHGEQPRVEAWSPGLVDALGVRQLERGASPHAGPGACLERWSGHIRV